MSNNANIETLFARCQETLEGVSLENYPAYVAEYVEEIPNLEDAAREAARVGFPVQAEALRACRKDMIVALDAALKTT